MAHFIIHADDCYIINADDFNEYQETKEKIEIIRSALTADDQTLRLHLGEMTAQEMRTLRAGFNWVLAKGKS